MINLQISTEVPNFFREYFDKTYDEHNTITINDFIKENMPEEMYTNNEQIINNMIHLYAVKGIIGVPIKMKIINNSRVFQINGKYYVESYTGMGVKNSLIFERPNFVDISTKINTFETNILFNVEDGTVYNEYSLMNKVPYTDLTESIYNDFPELLDLIKHVLANNLFEKYKNKSKENESSKELKLYSEWLKYHIRIFEDARGDK